MKSKKSIIVIAVCFLLSLSMFMIACDKDPQAIAAESIAITNKPADNKLTTGGTVTLSYTVTPADAEGYEIEWSSSDTAKATVDQSGKVTAVAAGSTFISVSIKDTEISDRFALTVVAPVPQIAATGISISGQPSSKVYNDTVPFSLTAALTPSNSTDEVVWTSSDGAVAVVSPAGAVTPKKVGTATIKASVVGNDALFEEYILKVYPRAGANGTYTDDLTKTVAANSAGGVYTTRVETELLTGGTNKTTITYEKPEGGAS